MPILAPTTCRPCVSVYDPTPHPVRGIPLQWHVRSLARQNGVFVDFPKGYREGDCHVDCCETPAPAPAPGP